jgi:hypothetical protein
MLDAMMPKKGSISPLEGELGPEIMMVAKACFMSMSLGMCQNLALTVGNALEGPLMSGQELAGMKAALPSNLPGLKTPGISAPSFPTPKLGGGLFG